jgi:5'-nucleotidase
MNILLTNDDGIETEGIKSLTEALRSRGKHRLIVLAPDSDRSGVSHGLGIIREPIRLKEKSKDTWACSGLPADCVIAAVLGGIPCKPDIVISGINHGANMGNDIIYSGTAAAARQGVLFGLPSIALSLNGWSDYNWNMAAEYSADHLEDFLKLWEKDIFINVNIPNNPQGPDGMVITWPCRKDYHDTLSIMQGPFNNEYCFLVPGEPSVEDQKGTDWDAVSANLVSLSPVFVRPVISKNLCPNAPEAVVRNGEGTYGR